MSQSAGEFIDSSPSTIEGLISILPAYSGTLTHTNGTHFDSLTLEKENLLKGVLATVSDPLIVRDVRSDDIVEQAQPAPSSFGGIVIGEDGGMTTTPDGPLYSLENAFFLITAFSAAISLKRTQRELSTIVVEGGSDTEIKRYERKRDEACKRLSKSGTQNFPPLGDISVRADRVTIIKPGPSLSKPLCGKVPSRSGTSPSS